MGVPVAVSVAVFASAGLATATVAIRATDAGFTVGCVAGIAGIAVASFPSVRFRMSAASVTARPSIERGSAPLRVSGDSTPTHPLVCCGTSFRLYGDGFLFRGRIATYSRLS